LGIVENNLMSGFVGNDFIVFRFTLWEILNIEKFFTLKIQLDYKNLVLEREINWVMNQTWANNISHINKLFLMLCKKKNS
jgi:hypothetical protein